MTDMNINKYRGRCSGCACMVEAGEGFYNGGVWCEEPKRGYDFGFRDETYACRQYHVIENRKRAAAEIRRAEYEASPEYAAMRAERDAESLKRGQAELAINAQGRKTCVRCGGAGRSDKWHATGYTCFTCEGAGTVEMSEKELKRFQKSQASI